MFLLCCFCIQFINVVDQMSIQTCIVRATRWSYHHAISQIKLLILRTLKRCIKKSIKWLKYVYFSCILLVFSVLFTIEKGHTINNSSIHSFISKLVPIFVCFYDVLYVFTSVTHKPVHTVYKSYPFHYMQLYFFLWEKNIFVYFV